MVAQQRQDLVGVRGAATTTRPPTESIESAQSSEPRWDINGEPHLQ
jgi:hypothetical protein